MTVVRFGDLPLTDRRRSWNGDAANGGVRKWAGAEDEPNDRYRQAFAWYEGDKKSQFTSYKLQIADVIDGQLRMVSRGLMTAGAVMQGARGGAILPTSQIARVKSHLARYYRKTGEEAPRKRD